MKNNDTFYVEYQVAGMYLHPEQDHYPNILFFRTGSFSMNRGNYSERM